MRFYISELIGDGSELDPWKPAFAEIQDKSVTHWRYMDIRLIANVPGSALVWTRNSDVEHTALTADNRITYIPVENNDGSQLEWDDALTPMNTGKFNQLTGAMESMNIPSDDLVKADTMDYVFERFMRVFLVQKHIRYVDIFDPPIQLHSDWSAIEITIRTVAEQRLSEQGFDLSVITPTATVNDVLIGLAAQNIRATETNHRF